MSWIAIEAYYLHLLVYVTFISTNYQRRMAAFYFVGYAIPAVLIVIWAAIKILNG